MWHVVQSQRMERLVEAFFHALRGSSEPTASSTGAVAGGTPWAEEPVRLPEKGPPFESENPPAEDPFTPEVVVVQDMGMARWITHRLAQHFGIAANFRFFSPAGLADLVYEAWLGEESPEGAREAWSRPVLTWRLFRLLDHCRGDSRFEELRHYMADDPSGSKRYELAARIAAVFDRYLVYRQDILLFWENGESDNWQAHLWRLLVQETPAPHPARRHLAFRNAARCGRGPRHPTHLPHRVTLFGLAMMAPVHFEVFDFLASSIPVTLYYLNPSGEYWGDARSGSEDATNPLVASWAHAGRDLFERIQNIPGFHRDCFDDLQPDTLLRAVQHDIHTLTDRRTLIAENRLEVADVDSIQIHACHSPMREVQVLHDRIAHFLENLPGLTPEDIVVMAPDIDTYAPYVEAVFGTRDNPRLPWNLSERKSPEDDPLLEKILDLLRLPQWRCTATDILALLETPPVAAAYGFDEKGLDRVRAWVREAGIRWGLDDAMRRELNLPGERNHTWRMGLDRLLAGYALPPRELFWEDILAYPHVEAGDGPWLGALHDLLETVEAWRRVLKNLKTPTAWRNECNALVDSFFMRTPRPSHRAAVGPKDETFGLIRPTVLVPNDPAVEESLGRFRNAVDAVCRAAERAGCSEPVSIEVIREALRDTLAQSPNIRRFLSGGVTFCNLVPMRAIPFRVVWLLGMNDVDFPRTERPPQFDLMAKEPRSGDRRRRWEDRYLFLEALLSARDVFCVSYVGRDIRDNSERVPSVVVSELLDYLEESYRPRAATKTTANPSDPLDTVGWGERSEPQLFHPSPLSTHENTPPVGWGERSEPQHPHSSPTPPHEPKTNVFPASQTLRSRIVVEHPLQPFSRRLFDGSDPRLFSYDDQWLKAVQTPEGLTLPPFMPPEASFSPTDFAEIALEELVRFFENPSAYFLGKALGLAVLRQEEALEEEEPFVLDALSRYGLISEMVDGLLRGEESQELHRRIRARGELPYGAAGDVLFEDAFQAACELAGKIRSHMGSTPRPVEVDTTLHGIRLYGWLDRVTERGRLTYRPAQIKAKDRLRLWICHLALCASRPEGVSLVSVHIGTGKKDVFRLEPVEEPEKYLRDLIELFVEGQRRPLPFFPESSWAYAEKCKGTPTADPPVRICGTAWKDEYHERGDAYDAAVRTAFRGIDPLDQKFADIACCVFGPILSNTENHRRE